VIVPGCGENFVAAAQHVLPHYLRRHVRIARLGQITIGGSADEAAFALRIEPASGLAVRNYRSEWRALALFAARTALLLSAATTLPTSLSTTAALSAASALVASAASIVSVITVAALLALFALSLSLSAAATSALPLPARRLRIVLRLRL